jgi:hypothetical protein
MSRYEPATDKPNDLASHDCQLGISRYTSLGRGRSGRELRNATRSEKGGSPCLSSMQDGRSQERFCPVSRSLSRLSAPESKRSHLSWHDLRTSLRELPRTPHHVLPRGQIPAQMFDLQGDSFHLSSDPSSHRVALNDSFHKLHHRSSSRCSASRYLWMKRGQSGPFFNPAIRLRAGSRSQLDRRARRGAVAEEKNSNHPTWASGKSQETFHLSKI